MTAEWYDVCNGGRQLASRVVILEAQVMKKCAIAVEGSIEDACREGGRQRKQMVKLVTMAQNEVCFGEKFEFRAVW